MDWFFTLCDVYFYPIVLFIYWSFFGPGSLSVITWSKEKYNMTNI